MKSDKKALLELMPRKKMPYPFETKEELVNYKNARYFTKENLDTEHNSALQSCAEKLGERVIGVEEIKSLMRLLIQELQKKAKSNIPIPENLLGILSTALHSKYLFLEK